MITLTLLIGYGGSWIPYFRNILQRLSEKYNINYYIYYIPSMGDTKVKVNINEIKCCLERSNIIFIYSHDLPEEIVDTITNLKKLKDVIVVSINPDLSYLSNVSQNLWIKCREYLVRGSYENLEGLIKLLLKEYGLDIDVPEVKDVPWHGIYHYRYGLFDNVEKYLEIYDLKNNPLVGILFFRTYWLNNDLEPLNKLIDALENEDLGVIPVFTYGFKDTILKTPSKLDSCLKFFTINDRVIIDLLLDFTSFFFTSKTYTIKDFEVKNIEEVEILKKINIPIIRPVRTWYQTRQEWLESEHGIDYISQIYQVIMPEVDGLIEPVVTSATIRSEFGIMRSESIDEHVKYLARKVKKWIRLRRKRPEERKIAIILINPPCKGLEANVAVGLGLDVPESIVQFLKHLKSKGYRVENEPNSGRELIKMILERKALNDFRWTSVEDIVNKGGALAFIDYETYMKWFEELPEDVKDKMIRDWKHPKEVLEGKAGKGFVGMVYNGKFVVPGLRFGNVVILPQPKFGCAGSRCDGHVCRILHDPTITPPHQWLAVYRWLTRVFDADVIIHFGTHGSLEFRPGKGVGLSWKCWPEISIDDTPHLYVYVVSNPMEGVIAKRRSYAVLIDHMHPAMTIANTLEELEELISQYVKARNLGEFERAKTILDMIISKAKENNIEVRAESPDEIIEELHRYIDKVKTTQINLGLHVLGNPPRNEKLAKYVVTVLMYDSPYSKSIIRTLVEYLGYDYDGLRKGEVKYIPELKMTSNELFSKIYEASVEIVHKLLMKNVVDDYEILSTVDEVLRKYNLIRN